LLVRLRFLLYIIDYFIYIFNFLLYMVDKAAYIVYNIDKVKEKKRGGFIELIFLESINYI
jgi:hypothetical protein